MKPPTDPPSPRPEKPHDEASARQAPPPPPERTRRPAAGGGPTYRHPEKEPEYHGSAPEFSRASDFRSTQVQYDDGVSHHEPGDHDELRNEDVAHEHRDIHVRAVITSATILAVVGVVSQVLMVLLFNWFEDQARANDPQVSPLAAQPTEMPPTTTTSPYFNERVAGIRLLTNEPMALDEHRAASEKRLHEFGWVDEKTGVAHMPIEDAKKLILQRGLPVRAEGGVPADLGTRLPATGEASGGRAITVPLPDPPAGAPPPPAAKPHGGH